MLWLQTSKQSSGLMNLGGSLTRQLEQDHTVNEQAPHLVNIGKMIEEMENKIRSTLNEIYFGKTKQIVGDLRSMENTADKRRHETLVGELTRAVAGKRQGSKDDA